MARKKKKEDQPTSTPVENINESELIPTDTTPIPKPEPSLLPNDARIRNLVSKGVSITVNEVRSLMGLSPLICLYGDKLVSAEDFDS